MQTFIHTTEGELVAEGGLRTSPVLSAPCRAHSVNMEHEPVPCTLNGEPCQCTGCIKDYKRLRNVNPR